MIMNILEKKGVYSLGEKNQLKFSECIIEQLVRDFDSYTQSELIKLLFDEISIIYSNVSSTSRI